MEESSSWSEDSLSEEEKKAKESFMEESSSGSEDSLSDSSDSLSDDDDGDVSDSSSDGNSGDEYEAGGEEVGRRGASQSPAPIPAIKGGRGRTAGNAGSSRDPRDRTPSRVRFNAHVEVRSSPSNGPPNAPASTDESVLQPEDNHVPLYQGNLGQDPLLMGENGRPVRRHLDPYGAREGLHRVGQQPATMFPPPPAPMVYEPFVVPYTMAYLPYQDGYGWYGVVPETAAAFGGFHGGGQVQRQAGFGPMNEYRVAAPAAPAPEEAWGPGPRFQEFPQRAPSAFQEMVASWIEEGDRAGHPVAGSGPGLGDEPAATFAPSRSSPTEWNSGQEGRGTHVPRPSPYHPDGMPELSQPLPTFDELMARSETQGCRVDSAYDEEGWGGGPSWNQPGRNFEAGNYKNELGIDSSWRGPGPTTAHSAAPSGRGSSWGQPSSSQNRGYDFQTSPDEPPVSNFTNGGYQSGWSPTEPSTDGWNNHHFNVGTGAPRRTHVPPNANRDDYVDPSPTDSTFSIESISDVGYVADASTRLFPVYEEPDDGDSTSEMEMTPIASGRLIEWKPPALTEEEVD
jgi:hypothetical protein